MIFFWMGLSAVIAVVFVILPLIASRGREPEEADDSTPAVLMDQLDEVQRDFDRNLISQAEADAATVEIKRRILAAARQAGPERSTSSSSGRAALLIAAVFVPAFSIGYYTLMGNPDVSSLAYADRQAERAEQQKIQELTDKLFARLQAEPDGGASEGWMLLGQTYYRMGSYSKAVEAFETVAQRDDATSAVFSMLAEALIQAEDGIVTPLAEAAADRAIAMDDGNPAGTFYKAMALEQKGSEFEAHDLLLARLNGADGFAPWMEAFVGLANNIGERIGKEPISLTDFAPAMAAAPGPTQEDVAAAGEMSEADRSDFIRSMVDRLATRLEDEPDDLDGWLRLANAYKVLGETDQAKEALARASTLVAGLSPDDPRRDAVNQAMQELN
jgi:cytochrome c-type biogenesis protein CcmH